MSGSITATEGNIGGFKINNQELSASGLSISATDQRIVATGSNSITEGNQVIMDGGDGVIQVFQKGNKIFESGLASPPTTAQKYIVRSLPRETVSVGSDVPVTTFTHMSASSQIGTARLVVDDFFRMTKTGAGVSNATPFYVSLRDPLSVTDSDSPTTIFFESSKSLDGADPAHEIRQTAVFSTVLNTNDDGARFVGSSNTTGSAIYHFQTILTEDSANDFDDAKLAHIRSDVDVHDLAAAQQKQFVHFDARTSSGSAHNQRVFQVQYDGDVVSAGNITAFAASSNFLNVSDKRLKKNIHTISESLNRILELRPTEFVWKENEKQDIGFIAQEVEKIIPEVVETSRGFLDTHTDDKSQDDIKTISYSKLVPYLVDTIQELVKRIEKLEKKVK